MAIISKKTASLGIISISTPIILICLAFIFLLAYALTSGKNTTLNTLAQSTTNINYTSLGDSITAADYAGNDAYAVKYKNYLNQDLGSNTTLNNLGTNAWKSSDLLSALQNDQNYRASIQSANAVTVLIGMNDFLNAASLYVNGTCQGEDNQDCLRNTVTNYQLNMYSIVDEIKALNANPNLLLRLADNFYPTTGNPTGQPYYTVLHSYMLELNQAVDDVANQNNIPVARLYLAYNGASGTEDPFAKGYLSTDGFHPSVLGHEVIANEFRKTGYAPLNNPPSAKILDPDVNNDNVVRIPDATTVSGAFGKDCGHSNYNPDYDLDGNCVQRVPDISIAVTNYGINWPPNNLSPNKKIYFYIKGTDPEGLPVTYSLSGLPQGATINNKGMFSWTPSTSQAGSYTATFTVTDSANQKTQLTLPITVSSL